VTRLDGPQDIRIALSQAREAHRMATAGVRLIHEGRPAEAIGLLRRAVVLNPGASSSHHDLGVALRDAGRLEQAIEPFASALRINSQFSSAHHNLGYIYDCLGRDEKALPHYQAAVALDPGLTSAQMRLGALYLTMGRRDEAVFAFRAVCSIGFRNTDGSRWRSSRARGPCRFRRRPQGGAGRGRRVSQRPGC
jgi:Flp pilus assembly protein TadD